MILSPYDLSHYSEYPQPHCVRQLLINKEPCCISSFLIKYLIRTDI